MSRYTKDPQAVLDYGLDWSAWLKQTDGSFDVIVSSSWTINGPDGSLEIDDDYQDTAVTGVWLSGGTLGAKYNLTCHIVTAAGREDDRTIQFTIKDR